LRPLGICGTLAVLVPPPPAEEGDRAQPSLLGQRGGGGPMRAPSSTFDCARTLRREMTLPEVLLWQALRRRQLDGLLFRRQHPVGPYVLDSTARPTGSRSRSTGWRMTAPIGRRATGGGMPGSARRASGWCGSPRLTSCARRAGSTCWPPSRLRQPPPPHSRAVPLLRDAEEDRPDAPDVSVRPGPGAARRYNLCEAEGSAIGEDKPCVPSRCWPDWPLRVC
jgi:hypothetical protein